MAMVLRSGAEARAKELTERPTMPWTRHWWRILSARRDFEGARERLAAASLDTLAERRAARSA